MKNTLIRVLLLTICFGFVSTLFPVRAQEILNKQAFDYNELKGLLSKHKSTVESILSMKRFKFASSKERPESTIHAYKKESDTTQILVRIRKSDGLVSEVAWNESSLTLAYLTHDAVDDGFVPVSGNSQYYNCFQNIALLVNYKLAEDRAIPCILRAIQQE
ncbi:hypothetical protein [Spirosoma pollinicola]|uniref:Uncharacterized protein n=1 Tax=Spirosoma pollinicola TaxID=2057025 RepID=A0A2K8Z5I5_9BACT|nr:hypothetical protein [Spirosoma pollinicola]AUD05121.1 hypothetical protein CWM47_26710 [Spirosoma pollinicola]